MQTLWQGQADLKQQQQDSPWPLAVSFQLLNAGRPAAPGFGEEFP